MRSKLLVLLCCLAFVLFSCTDEGVAGGGIVAMPKYVEIPIASAVPKALVVDQSNVQTISYSVFYHWYAPIVTGFTETSKSDAEKKKELTILGNTVSVSFSEENGCQVYTGISEDGSTFYSKVVYDPATDTFSYVQALAASLDFGNGGERERIDIVRGDSIKVNEDGTLKGTVRHYFLQKHHDGLNGTELGIGDGEFFSGSKGSGTVFKNFLNCNSEKRDKSVHITEIAELSPSFSDIESIMEIGDEAFKANHSDSLDKYYGMLWYDSASSSIFSKGDGSKGDGDIIASYDEAKALVAEHCGDEWELSDPATLSL